MMLPRAQSKAVCADSAQEKLPDRGDGSLLAGKVFAALTMFKGRALSREALAEFLLKRNR